MSLKAANHERGEDGHDHFRLELNNILGQSEYASADLASDRDRVTRVVHLVLVEVARLEQIVSNRRWLDAVYHVADHTRVRDERILERLD